MVAFSRGESGSVTKDLEEKKKRKGRGVTPGSRSLGGRKKARKYWKARNMVKGEGK